MTLEKDPAWLWLALPSAALMGMAIQRGTTCSVAAVEDWLSGRRPHRLLAILEASLWVGGGVLLLQQLGLAMQLPRGYSLTAWTLAGGVLLGLGAWLNRACAFGTIVRLGSGQWAYALTPLGFYVGSLSFSMFFGPSPAQPAGGTAPLLALPATAAWVCVGLVAARMLVVLRWRGGAVWSAHQATAVIGLSFLMLLWAAGAWSYTDWIADIAQGVQQHQDFRWMLAVALITGAGLAGLWSRPGPRPRTRLQASQLLRCLGGGCLMAWGGALIPGSNDGLLLLGMPLFWPYAWAALATMGLTIAAALKVERALTA